MERERACTKVHSCEGEAGGLLTWRVNALWGPGMGSFSAGAGTDKHTASFSAVRPAGDYKSRNVPEPLPSTVGAVSGKGESPRGEVDLFPKHFHPLFKANCADERSSDPTLQMR